MTEPTHDRRSILVAAAGLPALAACASTRTGAPPGGRPGLVRPPRLEPGDRVGMVNPASAVADRESAGRAAESLRALGLEPVLGPHYLARRGYFAGTDEQRAADIMDFVRDPGIKGIWAKGGWGSARVLPHLDFDAIAANPKVFVGYSDSTALLSAIRERTGLVVFHGPFPREEFTAGYQRRLLLEGEAPVFAPSRDGEGDDAEEAQPAARRIAPGKAVGPMVGGNLTVLTSIFGTPYQPDFEGAILFLEDVDEAVYRIDRMLTQLALAGVLDQIAGFVFGRCTKCPAEKKGGFLTLDEVLRDHVEPLGIPAIQGSMIGHVPRQFTLPLGCAVELDADAATLRLLEPAVT